MFPSVPQKRKDDNKMADKAGLDFPAFPYKPYDIQSQFMQKLYKVLEDGGVGLMESPTGTSVNRWLVWFPHGIRLTVLVITFLFSLARMYFRDRKDA
jgi:hypothetical protein